LRPIANRMTGQLEKKMQVYVWLGIQLLYKIQLKASTLTFRTHLFICRAPRTEWKVRKVGTVGAPVSTFSLAVYEQLVGALNSLDQTRDQI